eukprot:1250295-Rhodomonas_salina.1
MEAILVPMCYPVCGVDIGYAARVATPPAILALQYLQKGQVTSSPLPLCHIPLLPSHTHTHPFPDIPHPLPRVPPSFLRASDTAKSKAFLVQRVGSRQAILFDFAAHTLCGTE